MFAMLDVQDICVSYRKGSEIIQAVHALSLHVNSGEWITLTGKSGAGKSTLLHAISGYVRPQSGHIVLDGQDLMAMSAELALLYASRKLGYVTQNFSLVPDYSARKNILLPAYIHKADIDRSYFDKLVQLLGLAERLDHYPDECSGGEQQRIAIARALLLKPALILADEPTGSLDSKTSQQIVDLLMEANHSFGQAFLIATHDPSIAALGKRKLHLSDGRLHEA